MRKLRIPESLKEEFETVEVIWQSNAKTRRVDALLLCWIKYEKQLRRLFSFLVFQHQKIDRGNIDGIIAAIANNGRLYPDTFMVAIGELSGKPLRSLLNDHCEKLLANIDERINIYRNKLIHGQMTGLGLSSAQIEKDVILLMDWIHSFGETAKKEYGYDGPFNYPQFWPDS